MSSFLGPGQGQPQLLHSRLQPGLRGIGFGPGLIDLLRGDQVLLRQWSQAPVGSLEIVGLSLGGLDFGPGPADLLDPGSGLQLGDLVPLDRHL
jgi:hypothetical protein